MVIQIKLYFPSVTQLVIGRAGRSASLPAKGHSGVLLGLADDVVKDASGFGPAVSTDFLFRAISCLGPCSLQQEASSTE